jgi:hypothetical protein
VAERVYRPNLARRCNGVTGTSLMPLSTHALQSLQVWSKLVSNEGHFILDAETVFRPCAASHSSGVTETANRAFPACVVQALQVWSKSVRKEGHFILQAETVFGLSLRDGTRGTHCT